MRHNFPINRSAHINNSQTKKATQSEKINEIKAEKYLAMNDLER